MHLHNSHSHVINVRINNLLNARHLQLKRLRSGSRYVFCLLHAKSHQYCLCLISIFTLLACLHFLSNHFNWFGCLFALQPTQIDDFFSINHSSSSQISIYLCCSHFITHIFKMSTHNAIWIWCFFCCCCIFMFRNMITPGSFFFHYYYELLIFMIYLSVKEFKSTFVCHIAWLQKIAKLT